MTPREQAEDDICCVRAAVLVRNQHDDFAAQDRIISAYEQRALAMSALRELVDNFEALYLRGAPGRLDAELDEAKRVLALDNRRDGAQ